MGVQDQIFTTSSVDSSAQARPPKNSVLAVQVQQIPEKKGAFIKHVEYEVTCERFTVPRRYNDFAVLHDILTQVYPTRLLPRLPPKKALTDQTFITKRQKALARYLTILLKHPVIGPSPLFQMFLSFSGKDLQAGMKEKFKADERSLMPCNVYSHMVPSDWATRLVEVRDQMTNAELTVRKLKRTMDAFCAMSKDGVKNHMALNQELSNLCVPCNCPFTSVKSKTANDRSSFVSALSGVGTEVAAVMKQWTELASCEEDLLTDQMQLIKDLMKGWKDFFERQSKYATQDQKAFEKAILASRAKAEPKDTVAMEQKMATLKDAENRVKFSLYCVDQELIFLEEELSFHLARFLCELSGVEKQSAHKIAEAWEEVEERAAVLPGLCIRRSASSSPSTPS